MLQTSENAFRINPYTRWVYDHPAHLLPDPTPAQLNARRGQVPARRLSVELGSGSGNFLLQVADAHPDDHFVGFELRFKRLVKSARKMEKLGLGNVWVLRESAERFSEYFPPGSIDALHINFPDPWPKVAQWKKRMVNPEMLDRIVAALKPGGTFHLKTDHSGYFLHVLSVIRSRRDLRISTLCNDLHRGRLPGPRLESEFEHMFVSKRKPVYYIMLEKTGRRK